MNIINSPRYTRICNIAQQYYSPKSLASKNKSSKVLQRIVTQQSVHPVNNDQYFKYQDQLEEKYKTLTLQKDANSICQRHYDQLRNILDSLKKQSSNLMDVEQQISNRNRQFQQDIEIVKTYKEQSQRKVKQVTKKYQTFTQKIEDLIVYVSKLQQVQKNTKAQAQQLLKQNKILKDKFVFSNETTSNKIDVLHNTNNNIEQKINNKHLQFQQQQLHNLIKKQNLILKKQNNKTIKLEQLIQMFQKVIGKIQCKLLDQNKQIQELENNVLEEKLKLDENQKKYKDDKHILKQLQELSKSAILKKKNLLVSKVKRDRISERNPAAILKNIKIYSTIKQLSQQHQIS